MNDQDDDETAGDDTEAFVPDYFSGAIALAQIANNKTLEAALKKLRAIDRKFADAQTKLAAVQAQAAELEAALAARAAAADARDRALDARTVEFEASLAEAHAALRASHDNLSDADRRLRYRILTHADLLHGFNEQLQTLPDWQQIKQMIPGLPDDLPAPPAEVISENVREDWTGSVFVPGSSLTRTVRGAV
jgi:hypothetical protein